VDERAPSHEGVVPAHLLLLWDVDHTLIENGGVSKEIYAEAFCLLTGTRAVHPARTDGRTDSEIVGGMFTEHGLDPSAISMMKLSEALTAAAAMKVDELRRRGHALPGAREALAALAEDPGVVQSVLTGNVQNVAVVKLAAFGLDGYIDFGVGGFGSDDTARARLVGVARRKASAKYGVEFDESSTVLVGDTARDVRAARDGGARVVAVATGSSTVDELSAEGADEVLPSLLDTSAVVEAIQRGRGRPGAASPG
jgi:phosphoglycolate phosphatase